MKNISTKNLLASFLIFFATSCFIKAQPVIVIQLTNQTVIVGNSSKLSIGVSGTGPFTYQWQINGSNLPPNTTTKIAGYNNDSTFSGDGSKATNSSLSHPSTVVFDASGNLYITDLNNNRVRKINTEGIIATVVGNRVAGFSGDGGFATNAAINQGYGVASDTNGNLFLTDSFNQRIRKVSTNGIIETVVGNGSVGFSGDGGAATNASLRYPQGIAFDNNGNLFIADSLNNRIRKIDSSGTISTVAGNGIQNFSGDGGKATNASLFSPNAIAFDKDGNMFIADSGNGRIRKINLNGTISTVAGKGPTAYDIPPFAGDGGMAVNAQFCEPMSLATDSAGNLIIDDYCNSRIRKVSTNGIVSTIAGNGVFNLNLINGVAGTNFGLFYPRSIAVDAFDNVYIADSGNNGIVQIGRSSESPTLSFSKASLTDAGNYSVVVTSSSGSITSSFAILNVVEATKIIDQPLSRTNFASSTAAFMVNASGISLTYQWLKNSAPISGAVLPAFTLSNVQDQHAGVYSVIVNGLAGSVTSSPAVLTIDDTLFIASSPQNQTVNLGGNATFTTTAYGAAPLVFQWYFKDSPIGIATTGSNVSTFSVTNIRPDKAGNYSVRVFNGNDNVSSSSALLSILPFEIIPPTVSLNFLVGYPLLNLNGMLSSNFLVQYSTNLTGNNWINLRSISNLPTSPYQILDPAGIVPPARFYRVLMQ